MERTETFQYKRGGKAVAESFVSLADAYIGYDQEDFDFTDYSEVSEDDDEIFVEAITNADAKKMSVRFGSVRVQTHEVVLGDNPSCSKGAPMTLGWDAVISDRFDSVEEFEELRGGAPPTRAKRVSATTREGWLRDQGYSRESLIRATNEIVEIKHQRRETASLRESPRSDRTSAIPPRQPHRSDSIDELLFEDTSYP